MKNYAGNELKSKLFHANIPFLYNPLRGTEMKYWREMDKYKK